MGLAERLPMTTYRGTPTGPLPKYDCQTGAASAQH